MDTVDDKFNGSDNGTTSVFEQSTSGSVTGTDKDEIEVRKGAQQDTFNVKLCRFAVTGALLVAAVVVTFTTYTFLQRDRRNNFEVAFEQFSKTVGDAALMQQRSIREGMNQFANVMSASAQSSNAKWPFFTLPLFESYGKQMLIQTGNEVLSLFPVVTKYNYNAWIEYTNENHERVAKESHLLDKGSLDELTSANYKDFIFGVGPDGFTPVPDRDVYLPSWQFSPPAKNYAMVNWDLLSVPDYYSVAQAVLELKNETLVSRVRPYVIAVPLIITEEEHDEMHSKMVDSTSGHPHAFMFTPVHKVVNDYTSEIVMILGSAMSLDFSLRNLLPEGVVGIVTVIHNSCNQSYSFDINGKDAFYMGEGDFHETKYDKMEVVVNLDVHTHPEFETTEGHCRYSLHIFPSTTFEKSYSSNIPEVYATFVAVTFLILAISFFGYDMFVQVRNEKMIKTAARSNAIVSSMFPSNIRDRLISAQSNGGDKLKSAMAGNSPLVGGGSTKPLADLFLETTLVYADLCGFTAWSSVREPSQVFTLLETVFKAFDKAAKNRHVFKVETIGDCYVAAAGIPNPQKDHAYRALRFARDIMRKMVVLTKELEITLGPDTEDLNIRVGIHSGPLTAGILRGDRARFQLFGETVNTAARIEASGAPGRIHVSKDTAECLTKLGKDSLLQKRKDLVRIKGKDHVQTYWMVDSDLHGENNSNELSGDNTEAFDLESAHLIEKDRIETSGLDERSLRLVEWNVHMLREILEQIVERRIATKGGSKYKPSRFIPSEDIRKIEAPLEHVKEIIHLPEFDKRSVQHDSIQVQIPVEVVGQLRELVTRIAVLYCDNPFHNFEHASHVTMSVIKLLTRIVAPSDLLDEDQEQQSAAAMLHDHTYGITSDPLTQFACAFSALIHDADHHGVTNAQLVKEHSALADLYNNRSVLEQNSLVLTWDLLMQDQFSELRSYICATEVELRRFRQLVVNAVMATDITDKDLKELRNGRWDKAFKKGEHAGFVENPKDAVNRKATIVMEHLIQASDVAHTMQHWHVYRKWNERFFRECYAAFKAGRAVFDPTVGDGWYKGEIGFFDFYIIPLAKKLKDCGVFGKSSDEYLNYAISNRQEWEKFGQDVVTELISALKKEEDSGSNVVLT